MQRTILWQKQDEKRQQHIYIYMFWLRYIWNLYISYCEKLCVFFYCMLIVYIIIFSSNKILWINKNNYNNNLVVKQISKCSLLCNRTWYVSVQCIISYGNVHRINNEFLFAVRCREYQLVTKKKFCSPKIFRSANKVENTNYPLTVFLFGDHFLNYERRTLENGAFSKLLLFFKR